MIDFHCHLDLYPDPRKVLNGIDAHGTYVLAVTTTPKAWRGNKKLVGDRKRVRVALGLHPEVVAQRYQEVALLCGLLPEARYVGEIGLDGSPAHIHEACSHDGQCTIFRKIFSFFCQPINRRGWEGCGKWQDAGRKWTVNQLNNMKKPKISPVPVHAGQRADGAGDDAGCLQSRHQGKLSPL